MLGLLLGAGAAGAQGLDQFNATVEAFSSHHRVALAYLRTETSTSRRSSSSA